MDCLTPEYIVSVGLGMLLRVHVRMKQNGGDVKLSGIQVPVTDVFKLVRFDKLFHLCPTAPDTMRSFGQMVS